MIEHFNKLSPEEVTQFDKFVKSPFHNSNKKLIKLVKHLKLRHPDINKSDFNKKKIFRLIYRNEKYNDINFRRLISDYTDLFERFIIQLESEKDVVRHKVFLLTFLRKRQINKRFEKKYREILKIQKKTIYKETEYYLNQFYIGYEFYHYFFSKLDHKFGSFFEKQSRNIDYLFVSAKIFIFFDILNQNRFRDLKSLEKVSFYNEIKSLMENNIKDISSNHPLLYRQYNSLFLLATLEKKYYVRIENIIKLYGKEMDKMELSILYKLLVTYYVFLNRRFNELNIVNIRKAIKIYKFMHDNNLLLAANPYILKDEYELVVEYCIVLKDYTWCKDYIETYNMYLEPIHRNDLYLLSKAKLFFSLKRFEEIFPLLNAIHFKTPRIYIQTKVILSKIFFELKNFNEIKYIIENLREYEKEKKDLFEELKKDVKVYNKYLLKLLKISKLDSSQKKITAIKVKDELNSEKSIFQREWFSEKLNEF